MGRSVAPGAFGWKIPLGHGRVRVGLMCWEEPRPYFSALLQRVAPGLERGEAKFRQKAIGQMPVGNCVAERVVAIGEAAVHVKTSTGGGIYFGLLSAEMAAEVILRAFQKGDFSVHTLGEFERFWRTAFGLSCGRVISPENSPGDFPTALSKRPLKGQRGSNSWPG